MFQLFETYNNAMLLLLPVVYIWILIIKVIRYRRYKRNGGIRSKEFWIDIVEAFEGLPSEVAIAVVSSLAIVVAISGGAYFAYKKLKK